MWLTWQSRKFPSMKPIEQHKYQHARKLSRRGQGHNIVDCLFVVIASNNHYRHQADGVFDSDSFYSMLFVSKKLSVHATRDRELRLIAYCWRSIMPIDCPWLQSQNLKPQELVLRSFSEKSPAIQYQQFVLRVAPCRNRFGYLPHIACISACMQVL